jgi:hypothetical protein
MKDVPQAAVLLQTFLAAPTVELAASLMTVLLFFNLISLVLLLILLLCKMMNQGNAFIPIYPWVLALKQQNGSIFFLLDMFTMWIVVT